MQRKDIENKTLEELENDYWEPLKTYPSEMVKEVYSIRKKQIGCLDSNDIRLSISQDVGLSFLIPIAIKMLKENILEEGLYYPGDLLFAILNTRKDYWKKNESEKESIKKLINDSRDTIHNTDLINSEIKQELDQAIDGFLT